MCVQKRNVLDIPYLMHCDRSSSRSCMFFVDFPCGGVNEFLLHSQLPYFL